MKNVIKKGIVVIGLLLATVSFANEVKVEGNLKKTVLTLNDVKQGEQLSILDTYGTVIYSERIINSGVYEKGFDLTALPDGGYVFELNKQASIKTIPFMVSFSEVFFDKASEKEIFKPFVNLKNDIVLISRLSPEKETLDIELFYENGNEFQSIYSEEITDTKLIQRAYKLDENNKGTYKVEFISNGRLFTEYFTL